MSSDDGDKTRKDGGSRKFPFQAGEVMVVQVIWLIRSPNEIKYIRSQTLQSGKDDDDDDVTHRISCSHGGECEDCCMIGCRTVQSARLQTTYRDLLPPSSGRSVNRVRRILRSWQVYQKDKCREG
jgi:hypothetical protein